VRLAADAQPAGKLAAACDLNRTDPHCSRMSAAIAFDKELDTKGLNCPLPILRAKKALAELASGEVLKIVATDPGSVRDFQAFAKQTGNELLAQESEGKLFIHFLKRR
jgi:TusA-related sulfurtransferase